MCGLMLVLYWQRTSYSKADTFDKCGALYFCFLNQFMLGLHSVILTCKKYINIILILLLFLSNILSVFYVYYIHFWLVPLERALFLREQANNMYSVFTYWLGKSLVEIPFQITMPALFGVLIYWGVGFRDETNAFFNFSKQILFFLF